MTGYNEFIEIFGEITLANVVQIVLAGLFLFLAYKKLRDYLLKKNESNRRKDQELAEALEAVRKYPEYRAQSIAIQEKLESEIQGLRDAQEEQMQHLTRMEEDLRRREKSKLRDRLIQSYRYYADKEKNPLQKWTRMEADAFWDLFREYEEAGGDGYIHTVVQPDMERLGVVDLDDADAVAALMSSRK